MSWTIITIPDLTTDGKQAYRSECPDLPGVMSHGDTAEEAAHNIYDAIQLYYENENAKLRERMKELKDALKEASHMIYGELYSDHPTVLKVRKALEGGDGDNK